MSDPRQLPPRWAEIKAEEATLLEAELARETCEGHPLHRARVRALYRRYPFDDVLFEVMALDCPYYLVHLTWRPESNPSCPWITRFRSLEDFCAKYQMTLELVEEDPRWADECWRFHDP